MIKNILFVGVGGGMGSILRYLLSMGMMKYYSAGFPIYTFAVNISGCFLIGLLGSLSENNRIGLHSKLLLITGFCGGYTTFSAFSAENLYLLKNECYWTSFLYTAGSIIIGIAAVWLGNLLAGKITG